MNNLLSEKDTKAVLGILAEQLGVPHEQLTDDAKIEEEFCADSLTMMEIMMAVEDYFNISIPDEQWERISTVGDLFEELAEMLSEKEPEAART